MHTISTISKRNISRIIDRNFKDSIESGDYKYLEKLIQAELEAYYKCCIGQNDVICIYPADQTKTGEGENGEYTDQLSIGYVCNRACEDVSQWEIILQQSLVDGEVETDYILIPTAIFFADKLEA